MKTINLKNHTSLTVIDLIAIQPSPVEFSFNFNSCNFINRLHNGLSGDNNAMCFLYFRKGKIYNYYYWFDTSEKESDLIEWALR